MAKKPTKAQITRGALHEKQAIEFLRKRFEGHGQIVLPQVRNGTGHTYRTRTADALIVETWASRGIGFTGVEYKRSRHDWLGELKAPEKGEEIGQFCKYWVILAPAGLIDVEEMPELWGLWEIDGDKLKVRKKPPLRKYQSPTVEFVCSILRANREYDPAHASQWIAEMETRRRIEAEFQDRIDRVEKSRDAVNNRVDQFEEATGLHLQWGIDNAIEQGHRLMRYIKDPSAIEDALSEAEDRLKRALQAIGDIKGEKSERSG